MDSKSSDRKVVGVQVPAPVLTGQRKQQDLRYSARIVPQHLLGAKVGTLIKLGLAAGLFCVVSILLCGVIGTMVRTDPDLPSTAPMASTSLSSSETQPAVTDIPPPETHVKEKKSSDYLPMKPAADPVDPIDSVDPVITDHESVNFADLPDTSIMSAVTFARSQKLPPEAALRTKSSNIKVNQVAYLYENARVQAVGRDFIQVMLEDGSSAFLTGFSTRGLVSGKEVVPGLCYVTDTQQYTSILGASLSGWVIRGITDSEWIKAEHAADEIARIEKRNALRDELAKLEEQLANQRPDKLVSADGNHTTEAVVIGYSDGSATLIKTDGKEITVALEKLNASSQDIVRTKVGRRATAKKRIENISKELAQQ